MIKEKNGRYYIYDEDGAKNIGKKKGYATKAEAEDRLGEIEFFKTQSKDCRVNVVSKLQCNASTVGEKTIEGKKHIVITGARHMIGDTVMNRILYPTEPMRALNQELSNADSYVIAPSGHPMVAGNFAPAADPRSLINHNIGAFHFNWRIENNKLTSDTAICVEVAENCEDGREVLRRINENEDIDISTGFYLHGYYEKGISANQEEFDMVAEYLMLDHSAILLHEPGAKTSEQGVGLFANSAKGVKVPAINSHLDSASEFMKDDNEETILQKIRNCESVQDVAKVLLFGNNAIPFNGKRSPTVQNSTNEGQDDMKDVILKALNEAGIKTADLSDDELMAAYNKHIISKADEAEGKGDVHVDTDAVTKAVNAAIEPLTKRIGELESVNNSDKEATRLANIKAVVNHSAYAITQEQADKMNDEALASLAANAKSAANITDDFQVNSETESDFDKMEAPE